MTITNIPQKAIVRQSTKPTAPQAGLLWYDTSADILKQYKNGSFQSVSRSVDGRTVKINSNGEIESLPLKAVSNQLGGLYATDGNYDYDYDTATLDLTNISEVTWTVKLTSTNDFDHNFSVQFNGTYLYSKQDLGSALPKELTFTRDTSNLGTGVTITVGARSRDTSTRATNEVIDYELVYDGYEVNI